MGRLAPDFDFVQPAAVAGAGKQAQFSGDRAVIGEINAAIGGDCLQVRPRKGNQAPSFSYSTTRLVPLAQGAVKFQAVNEGGFFQGQFGPAGERQA